MTSCFQGTCQIVHRDLACRNVLVDSTRSCKVADFGRSNSRLATDGLLINTDGVLRPPSPPPISVSRGGTLLPSMYADACYIDAIIVLKAFRKSTRCKGTRSKSTRNRLSGHLPTSAVVAVAMTIQTRVITTMFTLFVAWWTAVHATPLQTLCFQYDGQ